MGSVGHQFILGDPLGLVKRTACNGRINAEKYMERLKDVLFQGTKAMLGKKVGQSSSHIIIQSLKNHYLPAFT